MSQKTIVFPPQLGIHYHVGFENDLYVDEFEGIRPDYRGPFKWHDNNLYYRYVKDGEFGVARVDASGSTARLIHETDLEAHNHLNFAFDVTSGGVVYFVYATQETYFSTLFIKRQASDGTVTTLLTDKKGVGALATIAGHFAAYLGAVECLFHNNFLYVLCPIQAIENPDVLTQSIADPTIRVIDDGRSGSWVTSSTRTEPSTATYNIGDNIKIRIFLQVAVNPAEFTTSDLNIIGGAIVALTRISGSAWDLTIRPDAQNLHLNIEVHIISIGSGASRVQDARILIDFGTERSHKKSAGMALCRCNVTAATPTLEVLETYDFVTRGACNLTVHDGAVHYVEHPIAASIFKPINPDLDGYWTDAEQTRTMGYNLLPESLGALKKVNAAGDVEDLGNLWYDGDRPFNLRRDTHLIHRRLTTHRDGIRRCAGVAETEFIGICGRQCGASGVWTETPLYHTDI